MKGRGKDYLWNVLQQEELAPEDVKSFSYQLALKEYKKMFSEDLELESKVPSEKEEIPVFQIVPGGMTQVNKPFEQRIETAAGAIGIRMTEADPSPPTVPISDQLVPLGVRVELADENSYKNKGHWYSRLGIATHYAQLSRLRELIGDLPIVEFGSSSGMASALWTDVKMYDLYPQSEGVMQGDMNDLIGEHAGRVHLLQYAYTFLNAQSRSILRSVQYVVIDDEEQPVWLEKKGIGFWSNLDVQCDMPSDRKHTPMPTLPFSQNLLNLPSYRIYSENVYVQYKRASGSPPTNGPFIASSLKEASMIRDQFNEEMVYLAPEGKELYFVSPLRVGTVFSGRLDSIWILEGHFSYVGPCYQAHDLFFLIPNVASSIKQINDQGEIFYQIQSSSSVSERESNGVYEVRRDDFVQLESLTPILEIQMNTMPPPVVLTERERLMIQHWDMKDQFSESEIRDLIDKGLVNEEGFLTKVAEDLPISLDYYSDYVVSFPIDSFNIKELHKGKEISVTVRADFFGKSHRLALACGILVRILSMSIQHLPRKKGKKNDSTTSLWALRLKSVT